MKRRFGVAVSSLAVLALAISAQESGWRADPAIVGQLAAKQPQFNYDEARVGNHPLPELLAGPGGAVRTARDWAPRRAAILELFREHVYGRSPGRPADLKFEVLERNPKALAGAATLERVAVISRQSGREHRFELTVFVPNAGSSRAPLFLLLNNRPASNADPTRATKSGFWPAEQMIARGYAIAALQVGDLAPDEKDRYTAGVIELFEGKTPARPANAWRGLAAWAWGASRAMDFFATHARIDPDRVALVGHSRGGKAALWAGAEDERFAMIVSNESGEGGAALSRRNFGETVARITEVFPHWFAANYAGYAARVESLPVDQHMLLALAAPRALYVASADQDLWSDPRGEFLSLAHASPAYALFGDKPIAVDQMPPLERPLVSGRRAYHVRKGAHDLTPYDWDRFADFADTIWKAR